MDTECTSPLDITDFQCTVISRSTVVVVFGPTDRHYTYSWRRGDFRYSEPAIIGHAAPHAAEVIDCLARAVAYKAVQDAGGSARVRAKPVVYRNTAALLQAGWTAMRAAGRFRFAGFGVHLAACAPLRPLPARAV